jgi:hypothetical protein
VGVWVGERKRKNRKVRGSLEREKLVWRCLYLWWWEVCFVVGCVGEFGGLGLGWR